MRFYGIHSDIFLRKYLWTVLHQVLCSLIEEQYYFLENGHIFLWEILFCLCLSVINILKDQSWSKNVKKGPSETWWTWDLNKKPSRKGLILFSQPKSRIRPRVIWNIPAWKIFAESVGSHPQRKPFKVTLK